MHWYPGHADSMLTGGYTSANRRWGICRACSLTQSYKIHAQHLVHFREPQDHWVGRFLESWQKTKLVSWAQGIFPTTTSCKFSREVQSSSSGYGTHLLPKPGLAGLTRAALWHHAWFYVNYVLRYFLISQKEMYAFKFWVTTLRIKAFQTPF